MTVPWLLCRVRRPDAALRMYCLPHSGGSAGEFLHWADELPDMEVWGVQPPGRGQRLDEEPFTAMTDLVHTIVDEVEFEPPYVLFGHSLGAAVAYEVARELHLRGKALPLRLYVSAHEAPHLHIGDPTLVTLDDNGLLAELEAQYGPLPPELRDDPDWRSLVLDCLRADLRIVADYRADRPATPLPCPIVAVGGADDDVPEPDLAAWADHTSGDFTHQLFPGGHFYFREHNREFLDFLASAGTRAAR